MPVILALWDAKAGGSPEVIVRDQPGIHDKTPSLLKYKNQLGVVVGGYDLGYLGGLGTRTT